MSELLNLADPLLLGLAAFLLTYLIHSTLLLIGAWSLEEVFEFESVRLRERLWRAALLGGFLTAGLQTGLGLETPVVRWALGPAGPRADGGDAIERVAREEPASALELPAPAASPVGEPRNRLAESVELARRGRAGERASTFERPLHGLAVADGSSHARAGRAAHAPHGAHEDPDPAGLALALALGLQASGQLAPTALEPADAPLLSASTAPASAPDSADAGRTGPARAGTSLAADPAGLPRVSAAASGAALGMVVASTLAGLLALVLLAGSAWRLRRRLAGSAELESGTAAEILADLRRRGRLRGPVRLLVSPRLRSPLSSGIVRPAIHVPPRALEELSREELEAMLAHELGHVARRDPAWLTLYWLVQQTCFFQPLNRLARRRLSTSAEVLADDWAVRHTGRHLSLASCLARVAGWVTERPRLLTAHMTHEHGSRSNPSESTLGRRIERLLDDERRAHEPTRRWWLPLAGGVLGTLALGAPGVAAHLPARAPTAPAAPRPEPVAGVQGEPRADSLEQPAGPASAAAPDPFRELPAEPTTEPRGEFRARPAPEHSPAPFRRQAPSSRQPSEPPRPRLAEPAPTTGRDRAPSADPALDRELVLLDDEVSALERELGLLREDLAGLGSDPALARTLERLEVHARSLSSRRDRMAALLGQPDPSAVRP